MRRSVFRLPAIASFLLLLPALTLADDSKPVNANPDVAAADQLYRAGKFADAETGYQGILKTNPTLVPAEAGLVRAMLQQQKIDQSLEAVNAALATQPGSAALLAAKGDVQFCRGELGDAEVSYLAAKRLDRNEVKAYLGLARIYRAFALYRHAYDQLMAAHEIAPQDIEVQRAWMGMLSRKERLAALEAYLSGPHPDDERESKWMREYLDFLKATVGKPVHACRLRSKVEHTETKLQTLYTDPQHIRGLGITVRLNSHNARLLLDTGAGGILVGRKVAEKAGLPRISALHYGGIGDQGLRSGYSAVADHLRIGELEFEDCVVYVTDKGSVADQDGLIGADVFSAYLVDLDLPGMRLNLAPLPKRPEDTVAPTSLNSEGEEPARAEEKETGSEEPGKKGDNPSPTAARYLPRDRYVAPEMAQWTKVFRFGHMILVQTSVNDSRPMLFGLDTGAFSNILSVRAGRQVTKVGSDETLRVRGVDGYVKKVYSADKAMLQFGHLRQENPNIVTLDLTTLSRDTGTEISGFLGFAMLRLLDVKLDYRDGLVDFEYNPNRVLLIRH